MVVGADMLSVIICKWYTHMLHTYGYKYIYKYVRNKWLSYEDMSLLFLESIADFSTFIFAGSQPQVAST